MRKYIIISRTIGFGPYFKATPWHGFVSVVSPTDATRFDSRDAVEAYIQAAPYRPAFVAATRAIDVTPGGTRLVSEFDITTGFVVRTRDHDSESEAPTGPFRYVLPGEYPNTPHDSTDLSKARVFNTRIEAEATVVRYATEMGKSIGTGREWYNGTLNVLPVCVADETVTVVEE